MIIPTAALTEVVTSDLIPAVNGTLSLVVDDSQFANPGDSFKLEILQSVDDGQSLEHGSDCTLTQGQYGPMAAPVYSTQALVTHFAVRLTPLQGQPIVGVNQL